MPLTGKGQEILSNMEKTYPSKKKAEQVFYASANKGTITGVHDEPPTSGASLEQINESNKEFWSGTDAWTPAEDTSDEEISEIPQVNKSNFNQGAGLTGRPMQSRDEREDKMGSGQNPHRYLQPNNQIQPRSKGTVSEYKPATKESLTSLNNRNKEFWKENEPFNRGS